MKAQDPAKHVSNADAKSGYEIADAASPAASFIKLNEADIGQKHSRGTRQEQARRPQGQRRGALSLRSPSCKPKTTLEQKP